MNNYSDKDYKKYYGYILKEVKILKDKYKYRNESKAFGTWFLTQIRNISELDAHNGNIDDQYDNGVDAFYIENDLIEIYQFKFPQNKDTFNDSQNEESILKMQSAFDNLMSKDFLKSKNEGFNQIRELLINSKISKYKLVFVNFGNHMCEDSKTKMENYIKSKRGINIEFEEYTKKEICNIFDIKLKQTDTKIVLKYLDMHIDDEKINQNINSFTGIIKGKELVDACKDKIKTIFNENIRQYKGKSKINDMIRITAENNNESSNFYYYNNGIVFICSNGTNMSDSTIILENASIINGCQTINSLMQADAEGKIRDDVYLLIRIFITDDMNLRSKITIYLNSQNKIKDSYLLANDSLLLKLHNDLLEKGIFLETQANSYKTKIKDEVFKKKFPKNKMVTLEDALKIYAGYYSDKYASIAKSSKNELFNKNDLISDMNADNFVEAFEKYNNIKNCIKIYKDCYKNNDYGFLNFIGVDCNKITTDKIKSEMDKYAFVKTADILLLNVISNLANSEKDLSKAIEICKDVISNSEYSTNLSNATKNANIFAQCREKIKKPITRKV